MGQGQGQPCAPVGSFYVLYDEAAEAAAADGGRAEDEEDKGRRRGAKGGVEWR